jgi:hypothetical protein
MELLDKPGWVLSGYKRMRNDPGLDAWRDTTSLFVKVTGPAPARSAPGVTRAAGVLHVDLSGFLFDQIHSIEITQTKDPARIVWAAATFATFFFGSLQRIYLPQVGGALDTLLAPPRAGAQRSPLRSGI